MNNFSLPVECSPEVFNSPLECGLRSTALLVECFPTQLDIQRLVQYDYLLVHSGDADGPASLHPATPHRSGELLIKRPLVEAGVSMMMQKSIIECTYSTEGILYIAGNWSLTFLDAIRTPYLDSLRSRAMWVSNTFGSMSNEQLRAFVSERWTTWGAEFELQAFVQGGDE
jgi:hypothetical protein